MRAPVLAIALAVAVAGTASAQTPLVLRASLKHPGRIRLRLTGPAGAQLDVAEGDREVGSVTLDATGAGTIADAGTWSCLTRDRAFAAAGVAADGTPLQAKTTVRTPSCRHRYSLQARPRRPRVGRATTVTLHDRFRLPVRGRVCARGPVRLTRCAGVHDRRARLRLPRTGRWRVMYGTARRTLTVRRRAGRLRVLATGDSMIQLVDSFLMDRLAPDDIDVRSDARISSGLSEPSFFDWPRHARKQVRRLRPDVTIVFIGANDSYPIDGVECCGKTWQRDYAKVASGLMSTYARGGVGTVFWCLLPAPRGRKFRRPFVAVNAAVEHAARAHRGIVHLIDLPHTFTPDYRYRRRLNGTVVRQDDGVHLSIAGASIAADLIIGALRRVGQL